MTSKQRALQKISDTFFKFWYLSHAVNAWRLSF